MPIYIYENKDGQRFQQMRNVKDRDKLFIDKNNNKCKRVLTSPAVIKDGQCQVWDKDAAYVKKCNPKFVKTRKGQRIKYNPSTMGGCDKTDNNINQNGLPLLGRQGQQIFINNKWWKWENNKWKKIKEKQ